MNKKINYGMILSVILVIGLLIGGFSYVGTTNKLNSIINEKNELLGDKDNALLVKDTEISNLVNDITSLSQNVVDAVDLVTDAGIDAIVDIVESVGYLIDGLSINDSIEDGFDNPLTDRELNLFDGKVDFADADYNMDEYLSISGITLTVNEEDFDENVYAVALENAIEYKVEFESDLKTNLIGRNNSLVFNFLGEPIEVIKWVGNEVTFKKATEVIIDEGESITVDGTTVLLDMVMDDSVYVTVDGKSKKIGEGETGKVGGIEVYVSDVLYTEKNSRVSMAVLAIGTDVEETVKGTEQYKDSIWNWIIDNHSIGLTLAEDFDSDLDKTDEDDYKPLGYGDKICLPNDYVCVEFVGLSDDDYSEYKFDYDKDDGETTITGDFENGTEDFDELIVNSTDMFYKDDDNKIVVVSNKTINLKNSDETLTYNGNITFGDLTIPMNVESVDGESKEGTYRSDYGCVIEIKNDLESSDDNKVTILIPEELVELSFLVY